MTNQTKKNEWIDDLLSEEMPYLEDKGFTQNILKEIEGKSKSRLFILSFFWFCACLVSLAFIPESFGIAGENSFEILEKTINQLIPVSLMLGLVIPVLIVGYLISSKRQDI